MAVAMALAASLLVTGCAGSAGHPSSAASCEQFAASAIRRHVVITAVPAACRGLGQVELNVVADRALRAAAAGIHGKAGQRRLIARDSRFVSGLVRAVPAASQPAAPVTATAPATAAPSSRTSFGLAALAAWVVTVGLGVSMMARWVTRRGRPYGGRAPVLNYAHFWLAVAGLLTWIGYLVSGVAGVAWAACGLLLPLAGLGMALVFLGPAHSAGDDRPDMGHPDMGHLDMGRAARRLAIFVIAAHVTAASVTILLAVLAAIGSG